MTAYDADFTRSNYRNLLGLAKQHYHFKNYGDKAESHPSLWWRHDVDMSMHAALALAKIEAELGVKATYFLLPGSAFYHLLEPEILNLVHHIAALGHAFGLHFDATKYPIQTSADLEKYIHHERAFLETYCGVIPTAFSFHNPDQATLQFRDEHYAGLTNTYADYFRTEVAYCSDSNGTWRHSRLQEMLQQTQPERLQVLTHPEWWTDTPMSSRRRAYRTVDGRARKIYSDNNKILQQFGRPNQDDLEDLFSAWESIPGVDALELEMLCLRGREDLAYLSLWQTAQTHKRHLPNAALQSVTDALIQGKPIDSITLREQLRQLTAAFKNESL